jgi:2-polyprenyl-3-methyl-5-hydroxy-6-metoxy-1,4-benzoquinol methylase
MYEDTYRTRIYNQYVQAREKSLAPPTVAELAPRAPTLCRLVRKHFPADKDAAVLDLGCGHGALIHFASQLGYRNVRGVDGSPEQVAAAQQLGIEGVVEGDLQQVLQAQPDTSLDAVVAFDVIEHFKRDELLLFVDEVHRVLKPNGRWIIHVPNGGSPFFGSIRYGDLTHEMAFTCTSLNQLLLSSGFSSVRCFEDTPVVHGAKSAMRWVLWKGFRSVLRLYTAAETGDTGGAYIFSRNMLAVASK